MINEQDKYTRRVLKAYGNKLSQQKYLKMLAKISTSKSRLSVVTQIQN